MIIVKFTFNIYLLCLGKLKTNVYVLNITQLVSTGLLLLLVWKKRFVRKHLLLGSCTIIGLLMLAISINDYLQTSVDPQIPLIIIQVSTITGLVINSMAVTTIFIYTAEASPTVIRASYIGFCFVGFYFGTLIVPCFEQWSNHIDRKFSAIPYLFYGIAYLVGSFLW